MGLPIVGMFLAGSAGTLLGAVVAMRFINANDAIGPFAAPVAGRFTGTYTGGGINFNAIALHYGVVREGALFAGATVVDNIVTTVWIVATLAVPRLLLPGILLGALGNAVGTFLGFLAVTMV